MKTPIRSPSDPLKMLTLECLNFSLKVWSILYLTFGRKSGFEGMNLKKLSGLCVDDKIIWINGKI